MQARDVFQHIRIGDPLAAEGFQVFPLTLPADEEVAYVLLDGLLEQRLAEITEVDGSGSVPELVVDNRSDSEALLLDGMELHGAKQNRMVNITLIIAAKSRTTIPVSCVERGRWAYRKRTFSYSGRTVSSRLRMSKSEAVLASLKSSGPAQADQRAVWNEVDRYLAKSGAVSDTAALEEAFARQNERLKSLIVELVDLDAHGAVVAIQGRIEGMDLLARRDCFRRLWPGLLNGYAIEAVLDESRDSAVASRGTVADWLGLATMGATLTPLETPGVGKYFECRSEVANGGIVTHAGKLVHAMLFPVRKGTTAG